MGNFNVVAQQRLFCKPTGERFWLGSPNPPASSHWCPCNTLKTHNASCLFVPGLLLRTHPICVNWIPSCPSYVCGGPPWKSLLEVWSESRRSLYNRPWSTAKVHWRRLDINATVTGFFSPFKRVSYHCLATKFVGFHAFGILKSLFKYSVHSYGRKKNAQKYELKNMFRFN